MGIRALPRICYRINDSATAQSNSLYEKELIDSPECPPLFTEIS